MTSANGKRLTNSRRVLAPPLQFDPAGKEAKPHPHLEKFRIKISAIVIQARKKFSRNPAGNKCSQLVFRKRTSNGHSAISSQNTCMETPALRRNDACRAAQGAAGGSPSKPRLRSAVQLGLPAGATLTPRLLNCCTAPEALASSTISLKPFCHAFGREDAVEHRALAIRARR